MSEITLHDLKSDCAALAARIATYEAKLPRILNIQHAAIELRAGERYAGEVLNADGSLKHRLALVSVSSIVYDWGDAMAVAARADDGSAPDRQEGALLIANCKLHLPASGSFWLADEYEGSASHAWCCGFGTGYADYDGKRYERQAVVVRRLNP